MDSNGYNAENMPGKGFHLFLVILGFLLGVIWGALSVGPYKKMKEAITAGDSAEAWANARKIRRFVLIGVVVNVLFIIGKIAQG